MPHFYFAMLYKQNLFFTISLLPPKTIILCLGMCQKVQSYLIIEGVNVSFHNSISGTIARNDCSAKVSLPIQRSGEF